MKDHAVMTFGRMNPPTVGHAKLISKVREIAAQHNADHHIFVSQTQDKAKNPLTHRDKVSIIRKMIPRANVRSDQDAKTIMHAAKTLHSQGYKKLTVVAGSDRVKEFHDLLNKYNGKEDHYNFDRIHVVSAGDRDPDAEGVEGMSASKMRGFAKNNDFDSFAQGVPNRKHAKELYKAVRKGMQLESRKGVFVVGGPGSGKDIILKTSLDTFNLREVSLEKLHKAILEKANLPEMVGNPSIIINGNADDKDKINLVRAVLENVGYDLSMVFVYTSDDSSKTRNDQRMQGKVKTFSEERRSKKYNDSVENMKLFSEQFDKFFLFDNSRDYVLCEDHEKKEIAGWFMELNHSVHDFLTEKHPALVRAGVEGFNKPKRTPGHPKKSHIVVTKINGKVKTIRFGEQGAETAGDPKAGESDRMKKKRASFKARHRRNIARGKVSPAYWANKVKW